MIQTFEVFIPTTNTQRTIRVYKPDACTKDNPCDILLMHDGQNLFDDEMSYHEVSWRVIDGLKKANQNMIIVGIDNSMQRLDEYSPYETNIELKDRFMKGSGGLGWIYIDFVMKDLLPRIQKDYPTTQDIYMAGSSMGAYISMFAAIKYPHLLRGIGCFSIASWFNEEALLLDLKQSSLPLEMSFYISVGKHETSAKDIKEFPEIYINNSRRIYEALIQKDMKHITFNMNDGYHNERQWMELFPKFIQFLYNK